MSMIWWITSPKRRVGRSERRRYVASGAQIKQEIPIVATDGVRYTVPQSLDVSHMADLVTVRFRVGDVYKGRYVSVYYDGTR
jgi:hypothetical protein